MLFALLFATVGRPLTLPVVGAVLPTARAQSRAAARRPIDSIAGQPIHDFEDIQQYRRPRAGDSWH